MVEYGTENVLDSWMELVEAVRDTFPDLDTVEALRAHRDTVLQFMREKRALCVMDGDRVVGAMLYSVDENRICFLAVAPDYRRRGVANALLSVGLAMLDLRKDVSVSAFRADHPPRALYEKFGFVAENADGASEQQFVRHPKIRRRRENP